MNKKKNKIIVLNNEINITKDDFISLTDMLKSKDGDFFISDWLRNRNTIEYLGIWERIHNSNFNYGEFAIIKSQAGLNSYKISIKEWVSKTNAIGLTAKAGRYGGSYAHKDIAFEFGMWISAEFKINYRIHTGAIKENLIPSNLDKKQISFIYANEADVFNILSNLKAETKIMNKNTFPKDIKDLDFIINHDIKYRMGKELDNYIAGRLEKGEDLNGYK